MAKENIIQNLEERITTHLDKYKDNYTIPEDYNSLQAIQLISKELTVINTEKKRIFDEKMNESRLELEKDHKYWQEKFESDKFNKEHELAQKRLELDTSKQNQMLSIESTRLEIEKTRLKLEESKLELDKQKNKDDQKYRYLQLGLTIGVPAITSLISLLVYRKLAYNNLKLIYVDEGRPTTDFKDAVKCVKNLTK